MGIHASPSGWARRWLGPLVLGGAALLSAAGVGGAGLSACHARRGSGLYVEVPAEIFAEWPAGQPITLKVRLRAVDGSPFAGAPPDPVSGERPRPVVNDLPAQEIVCPGADPSAPPSAENCITGVSGGLEGRHGVSIRLSVAELDGGAAPSLFDGVEVVVHVALFADTVGEVDAAFRDVDNVPLSVVTCGSIDCAHAALFNLQAMAARSVTLPVFGRSDANAVLHPLSFMGTDVDPDGDTIPGAGATTPDGTCLLAGDYPWESGGDPACETMFLATHVDCDDFAIAVNPFEIEAGISLGNRCFDGDDQNCDGVDGPCADVDGDGFPPPDDCNDGDPTVYPGAPEDGETACSDGIDNDCTGGDVACACDADGDLFCVDPIGSIPGGDCCEDMTGPGCIPGVPGALVNPGAAEVCGNGYDENCDGIDPPCASPDADGDGHCSDAYACAGFDCSGTSSGRPVCCLMRDTLDPVQLAACTVFDDCADWNADRWPGNAERCGDGVDQDCDGSDPGCVDDADADGFTAAGGDCNDADPLVHPGAAERCDDGIDQDCVGGDASCATSADADGDGWVDCAGPLPAPGACDCDPADPAINPGASEVCDPFDNDCDGVVNDGNPGGSSIGDPNVPDPCYGNPPDSPPPATPPYVDPPGGLGDETWRCRVGRTACSLAGTLVCIEYVPPTVMGATECETADVLCNGRNDVCVVCGDGGTVPADERDTDGDGCIGGCASAPTPDGVSITVGDDCDGADCCDVGSEVACMGSAPAGIYPDAPETCGDVGIDNDCDGDTTKLCSYAPMTETCNGADEDCDCETDYDDPDAQAWCGAGLYCNGSSCVPGCDNPGDCTNANACNTTTNQCYCGGGGTGAGCTGNYTCSGGVCTCGGTVCPGGESCGAGGDCCCGAGCAGSGEACPAGPNPECIGSSACGCDADSTCEAGETCDLAGGDCDCGSFDGPNSGPACGGSSNPNCNAGMNRCECDGNSVCDIGETCGGGGGGDCDCGLTDGNDMGEACPDASTTAPDCNPTYNAGMGRCDCGGFACGSGETCSGPGGDCCCGGSGPCSASGEACGTAANPDCNAGMNRCDCGGTLCGSGEACDASSNCCCGATCAPTGEACTGTSPDCTAGACTCGGSTCGAMETCNASGDCACGTSISASTGEACPGTANPNCAAGGAGRCECDGMSVCGAGETCMSGTCWCAGVAGPMNGEACTGTQNPNCGASGCECDANSQCGPGETCNTAMGRCECGGSMPMTGSACASPEECVGGVCRFVCSGPGDCPSGWPCDATGVCECNDDADCETSGTGNGPKCTVVSGIGLCDCNGGSAGPYCGDGEECLSETGTTGTDCTCIAMTCM